MAEIVIYTPQQVADTIEANADRYRFGKGVPRVVNDGVEIFCALGLLCKVLLPERKLNRMNASPLLWETEYCILALHSRGYNIEYDILAPRFGQENVEVVLPFDSWLWIANDTLPRGQGWRELAALIRDAKVIQ